MRILPIEHRTCAERPARLRSEHQWNTAKLNA
jgi:hypothetical protein